MRVRALASFVARIDGQSVSVRAGQLIDLPAGADWLRAGLVAPAPDDLAGPETASVQAGGETAALPRARRKRG